METDQRPRSYYAILGVDRSSSIPQIRSAYRKLAMQWHPDKWRGAPSHAEEAKRRFQQIQEAYAVLSDQEKRLVYDAGLYDDDDVEEDDGFSEFVEEMVSLMANVRQEKKSYSEGELQRMLLEMAEGHDSSQWFPWFGCEASFSSTTVHEASRRSKRFRSDADAKSKGVNVSTCQPWRYFM